MENDNRNDGQCRTGTEEKVITRKEEEILADKGRLLVLEEILAGPHRPLEVRIKIVPTPNPCDQHDEVDKNMKNCIMLYAKDLTITWGGTDTYWRWPLINEHGSSLVVAELIKVCWLHVDGKFNTMKLTPGTLYEVVFVVMLKDDACGWEDPINLWLSLPNGSIQEHQEHMEKIPRGKWIEIPAGEFETLPENTGEMKFSLYEHGGIWKEGLLVKGVLIKPKY